MFSAEDDTGMGNRTTLGRTRRWLSSTVAAIAITATLAGGASAQGVTAQRLGDQGWTCFTPPTVPDWVVCYNPGLGRPFLGNPEPRPSYAFLGFDRATGVFTGTGHLIRADLYRGQPCVDGAPYVFRALIGYYECVR
jgi:hypothetical protein